MVTNLALNAREAGASQLRVGTTEAGNWAIVEIADNGSGMSADFIRNSLYRAFQTTKKNGMGIGMFHSKMIVEAHGGRMAVESTPDKGTTFRVFVPISS